MTKGGSDMSEPHAIGRFLLRVALLVGLLLVIYMAAPLLEDLKKYPIEALLGAAFLAIWAALIMFFEKLIFGIPYPSFR